MKIIRLLIIALLLFSAGTTSAAGLKVYSEYPAPTNDAGDRFNGIVYDQVLELLRRTRTDTPVEVVSWKRGYSEALSWADIALFPTTRTPEREELFHWVGPLLRVTWAFYGLDDSGIRIETLEDAKKIGSIGIYEEDSKGKWLEKQGFTNLVSVIENQMNIKKLYDRRIDLMAGTVGTVSEWPKMYGLDPSRMVMVYAFKNVDLYLAFSRKTAPSRIASFKQAFTDMVQDGTVREIYEKWMPGLDPPVTPETIR